MFNSETRIYNELYKIAGRKVKDKLGEEAKGLELDNLSYKTYLELPEEIKEKVDLQLNRLITRPLDKKFKNKLNKLGVEINNLQEFKEFGKKLKDNKMNKDSVVKGIKKVFSKSKTGAKKTWGFTKRIVSNIDKFGSKGGFKKIVTLLAAAGVTVGVGFVMLVLAGLGVPITDGWFLGLGLLGGTIALAQVVKIGKIITEIYKENKKNKIKVEDIEKQEDAKEKEESKEETKTDEIEKAKEGNKTTFELPGRNKEPEIIEEDFELDPMDGEVEEESKAEEVEKPKFVLPSSKKKVEVVKNNSSSSKQEETEKVEEPKVILPNPENKPEEAGKSVSTDNGSNKRDVVLELEQNILKYDVREEEIINCEKTIEKANNVINAYRKYYNPNMSQEELMKIRAYKNAYTERENAIKQVEIYKKRHDYATTAKRLANNLRNSHERLNRNSISEREVITNTGEKKTIYVVNQVSEPLERIVYDNASFKK